MGDNIELVYFDVQGKKVSNFHFWFFIGRGTIIRILLRIAGCDWKDTKVPCTKEEWAVRKPDFQKEALGSLPILRLNGQIFYQTEAIIEWATNKAGLRFSCPEKRMKVIFCLKTEALLLVPRSTVQRLWITIDMLVYFVISTHLVLISPMSDNILSVNELDMLGSF